MELVKVSFLVFILLFSSSAFSQLRYDDGLLVDFEDKNPIWYSWNCEFDIVENPNPSGINTSEKVGYFLTTDPAFTWEGALVRLTQPLSPPTSNLPRSLGEDRGPPSLEFGGRLR